MNHHQRQGDPTEIVCAGTYRDAKTANDVLRWAMEHCHLVSPATAVGDLPAGFAIVMAEIWVDIRQDDRGSFLTKDTYEANKQSGERGLSKAILNKIGSAYGLAWDPHASGRVDDGSDPKYCKWVAVAHSTGLDGQTITHTCNKEVDLRDGSPQVIALQGQQARYNKSADNQVREARLHIQSNAETKAKLRLIREACSLKTAYTLEELTKRFVVVRLMYTGKTGDRELDKTLAVQAADRFLGGSMRALYGGQRADVKPVRALPETTVPPDAFVPLDDDDADYEYVGRREERVERPAPKAQPAPKAAPAPAQQQRAPTQGGQQRGDEGLSGYTMPFGNSRGMAIEDAPDEDLAWMADHIRKQLVSGKNARFAQQDQQLLNAIEFEIDKRSHDRGGKF